MFHIIVCMKIVIDPEMPFSEFKVDRENKRAVPPTGVPPQFSPFDENALEWALKIKENTQDCKVTVLSVGKGLPKAVLQKAIAAGADDAIAVDDSQFDSLDSFSTARVLALAIDKIGGCDLVFCGRQGADWDGAVVWAAIADNLDMPCITLARKIEVGDGVVSVERCTSDSVEVVEAPLPALVTFSSEAGELRGIGLPALIAAKKRTITKWTGTDVGFEPTITMVINDLFIPETDMVDSIHIEGSDFRDKGRNLARYLKDACIVPGGH
jgi:electron transfer flavoprotein beta subunit